MRSSGNWVCNKLKNTKKKSFSQINLIIDTFADKQIWKEQQQKKWGKQGKRLDEKYLEVFHF